MKSILRGLSCTGLLASFALFASAANQEYSSLPHACLDPDEQSKSIRRDLGCHC